MMTAITAVKRIAQAFWKQAFKRRVEFLLWIIKRPDAIQTLREIKTRKVGGQKVPKGPHQKCEMPLIWTADASLRGYGVPKGMKRWQIVTSWKWCLPMVSSVTLMSQTLNNWINQRLKSIEIRKTSQTSGKPTMFRKESDMQLNKSLENFDILFLIEKWHILNFL